MLHQIIICSLLAGCSYVMTHGIRRWALHRHYLDVPNARSSHSVPTPRGGGVAVLVVFYAGVTALWLEHALETPIFLALICGLPIAAIGLLDDLRGVSFLTRLGLQFCSAVLALVSLHGVPALQLGTDVVALGLPGNVFGLVAIVWSANLFNFMDGIDGLAVSEAVFIFAAAAALVGWPHGPMQLLQLELLGVAACVGFMIVNWPPAKIFMGDVGSCTLGFLVAVLAMSNGRSAAFSPFVWLTLGGVFFVDSTVTLVRRVARGERVADAHRSHAYQWAARQLGSHRRATLALWVVNLVWLLPWAYFEVRRPDVAGWLTLAAIGPLSIALLLVGAGRAEPRG